MKIENKSQLCELINDTITTFRENNIQLSLKYLIEDATNLNQAVENTMFNIVKLLKYIPIKKKMILEHKFGDYLRNNLNIEEMHNHCKNMYNYTLTEYEEKLSKMSKLELNIELNNLNKAIKYYDVLTSVKNMRTMITFFRTQREYIEMYLSDFKFLTKEKRLELFEKEIDEKIDYCISTIPVDKLNENIRHGSIDKTFIKIINNSKGNIQELETPKNSIMDYEEIKKYVSININSNDFEILEINLFSRHYVKSKLSSEINIKYYEECRNKFDY